MAKISPVNAPPPLYAGKISLLSPVHTTVPVKKKHQKKKKKKKKKKVARKPI